MNLFRRKKGIMMAIVMMIMPVCIMLGAIMLSNIISEKHFLRYERDKGQSFYLAETGLNSAFYAFSQSTFTGFTHFKDNDETDPNEPGVINTANPLFVPTPITDRIPFQLQNSGDYQGWYEFSWDPGSDIEDSLTRSGHPERIWFRVSRTFDGVAIGSDPSNRRSVAFEIVCVASLGQTTKTHRLFGSLEGLADSAIFDNGSLNEFIRGQNQDIHGKVHANGDIYLKPSNTTLSIETTVAQDGFTTAGNFWYGRDATGRTNMGNIRIAEDPPGSGDAWPAGLDSFSDDWAEDAGARWGEMVRDKAMGAGIKEAPPVKSFEPGGFYQTTASSGGLDVRVNGGSFEVGNTSTGYSSVGSGPLSSAVTSLSFYNNAERRTVQAVQIDVSQLDEADYGNGLIYSEVPVVLVNAHKLPKDTTFASQSGIYTVGDFNMELPTQDDFELHRDGGDLNEPGDPQNGTYAPGVFTRKKSAALMTKDRIWHLSKEFDFSRGPTGVNNTGAGQEPSSSGNPTASDPKHASYPDDLNDVIEINGMLLDGAPLYDESWNREKETDPETGEIRIVPRYGPGEDDEAAPNGGSTSWDDFLENFGGGRTVRKRGSVIHLQNATMSFNTFDDANNRIEPSSNIAAGITSWYRCRSYNPPHRDYAYDVLLKTNPPPFAPFVASRSMWKRY